MAEQDKPELTTVEKTWFTIAQAAEYLDVSEPTIYRWMRDGKLSFYKVGDSTRFKRENLDMVVEKYTGDREADYYGGRCVACGHSRLVPGKIQSTGNVYFRPSKARFFTLLEAFVRLEARVCPRCGFVQLFASTDRLDRLLPGSEKVRGEKAESRA